MLLTGATGFVGGAVAAALRGRDEPVDALVRTPSTTLDALGVRQHVVDLTDVAAVTRTLAGIDAVVHCAAGVGPDLETARQVNRDLTRTLVTAAGQAGVSRFVHLSTTAVYDLTASDDAASDDALVTETAPLVTSGSPYAVTKAEAEAEVAEATGLARLVLRPPAVLGVGATSTWGTRVPELVRNGAFPAQHPASTFAFVALEDLVAAVLAGLDAAATGTLNVIGGHATWADYLGPVAEATGAGEPPLAETATLWQGRYATDRLATELGVTPQVDLEAAMAPIIAAWS